MPQFKKYAQLLIALCCVQFSVSANPIKLAGNVINDQGKPVSGALLQLLNANISTTTNAQGTFSFASVNIREQLNQRIEKQLKPTMGITNGILSFQSASQINRLEATVHDLTGRQLTQTIFEQLKSGTHSLRLYEENFRPASTLLVKLSLDGSQHCFQINPQGYSTRSSISALSLRSSTTTASTNGAVDTLRVKIGAVTKDIPITDIQQTNLTITINYTLPTIPELPSKTIAEQKAAKQTFKSLVKDANSGIYFAHQDNDPNKDVIGIIVSTQNKGADAKVLKGIISDEHIELLKNFPKLQAICLQNQMLTDGAIAKLAQFPYLTDVRFHYMDLHKELNRGPNFVLPLNVLRNLRVLELKHNMSTPYINLKDMTGFPMLQRLVLDNKADESGGAATDEGMAFAARCPNLEDLHYHRSKISKAQFIATIAALPKLKLLWLRSTNDAVTDEWFEGFRNLKALEDLRLDGAYHEAAVTSDNLLMPLKDVASFKQIIDSDGSTKASAALIKVKPNVKVSPSGGHVDRGYVLPVFTDFNKVTRDALAKLPNLNM